MPVKSAKQFRFMEGIAHGMKSNKSDKGKNIGPSPDVAKEMLSKTSHKTKSAFAKTK
jgi:hypothetical protein